MSQSDNLFNTTTYSGKFTDRFGRTIEYIILNTPYLERIEDEHSFIFLGETVNRIIFLRNELRSLVETRDTDNKYWVIKILYGSGKIELVRDIISEET